jgi:hypothetical protein
MKLQVVVVLAVSALSGCEGSVGPQGIQGPKGDPGPMGAAAGSPAPGASYHPVLWFQCGATLDLYGSDGIKETGLDYLATVYSNEDAEIACTTGFGTAQDGSGYTYFPGVLIGSGTGACQSAYDFPPVDGVAGYWRFEVVSKVGVQATYVDSPNARSGMKYTFKEQECTALTATSDGGWNDTTMAALFQ